MCVCVLISHYTKCIQLAEAKLGKMSPSLILGHCGGMPVGSPFLQLMPSQGCKRWRVLGADQSPPPMDQEVPWKLIPMQSFYFCWSINIADPAWPLETRLLCYS